MIQWAKGLQLLLGICLLMIAPQVTWAQLDRTRSDSARSILQDSVRSSDTTRVSQPGDAEIELSEITIEAVVEKPSVAILPRRLEPRLEEMEFIDRSFERELKKVPTKPLLLDDQLVRPKKIEDLKQKLLQKKKE
ncbi:MAG: hypothetical protein ONB16_02615 [candidate division KSB1 bacterium]|nr:hypothetical protein [candidate division KSB1 bacterium]MDZ7319693.1 hypothetical protein [candidate division KSB1 bacterium]MDZ7341050.1 hypothetical protein [candidate division KSB1 bacterium]